MARLSDIQKQDLIESYLKGKSAYALSKEFNISPTAIYGLLKRRGVPSRSYSESSRKYTLNEHYFDTMNTWQKAYLLGFLMADGYNNEDRNVIQIIVAEKDIEVLEFFKKELECNKPIGNVKNKNILANRIDFCSQRMSKKLSLIGCHQRKTYSLDFPEIDNCYLLDFMRGYFDGDGCFYYGIANRSSGSNVLVSTVTITSAVKFLEQCKNLLSDRLGITSKIYYRNKDNKEIGTLTITGNKQVMIFMDWIYQDENKFCLSRKHKKYIEFLNVRTSRLNELTNQRSANGKKVMSEYNEKVSQLTPLSSIVNTACERWNARYFMTHGIVEHEKQSRFTVEQAKVLRDKLDEYFENSAIPETEIECHYNQARQEGFPYYKLSKDKFNKGIETLKKAKLEKKDNMYNWAGNGSELASYFHPHMFQCKRKGKMSALQFFESDVDFKRGISKLIALYDKITPSKIREICRNEQVSSRINNFPPRVAMSIINELYSDRNDIVLIDPTHGFSGRLIGSYCSGKVKHYIGIDLSKETSIGALKTQEWLGDDMKIDLVHGDCLAEMSKYNENDLLLTSPPFLDIEQYYGVNFETNYDAWISNFIEPFINNAYNCLKQGGKMAVYLEKINRHKFPEDFANISIDKGFQRCDDILFRMGYGENNRNTKSTRGISILVFQK